MLENLVEDQDNAAPLVYQKVPYVEVVKPRCLEDWVASGPLSITSLFVTNTKEAFSIVEDLDSGMRQSWRACAPKPENKICSVYAGNRFVMYEFDFKEVGMRLPFTNLKLTIFNWLQLSQFQLHPNALFSSRILKLCAATWKLCPQ